MTAEDRTEFRVVFDQGRIGIRDTQGEIVYLEDMTTAERDSLVGLMGSWLLRIARINRREQ